MRGQMAVWPEKAVIRLSSGLAVFHKSVLLLRLDGFDEDIVIIRTDSDNNWKLDTEAPPSLVQRALTEITGRIRGEGRYAPKGTQEVMEDAIPGSRDIIHGGDSSSAEVPNSTSAGGKQGQEDAQKGSRPPESSGDAGVDSEDDDPSSHPGSESCKDNAGAACLGHRPRSVPDESLLEEAPFDSQESGGEGIGGPGPAESSDPGECNPRLCSEDAADPGDYPLPSADGTSTEPVPAPNGNWFRFSSKKRREDRTSSRRSTDSHGGRFADLESAHPASDLVRRLRRVMAQMIGGHNRPGGRWSSSKVAVKVAGYLRPLTPGDRRQESGRPAILVLPDVSGSMSAFATEVVTLAKAVGHLGVPGADVIVVSHSNGYPEQMCRNAQPPVDLTGGNGYSLLDNKQASTIDWYLDIIRKYNVQAIILAADWDGSWLYSRLAREPSIRRIYWLDVWSCSRMSAKVVKFPPKYALKDSWCMDALKEWTGLEQKVRYALGCGTAEEGVSALAKMIE